MGVRVGLWVGLLLLAVAARGGHGSLAVAEAPRVIRQVHLALTERAGELVISAVTLDSEETPEPEPPVTARMDGDGAVQSVQCSRHTYAEGEWAGHVHDCLFKRLRAGVPYTYTLHAGEHSTPPRTVRMPGGDADVRVAIVGDTGVDEDAVRVMRMVEASEPDLVLHLGDFGYSTFPGEWDVSDATYAHIKQTDWDLFFDMIEPVASRAPYMTIPGNHEGRRYDFDFIPYTQRFRMPGPYARAIEQGADTPPAPERDLYRLPGLWYSVDIGTTHLIGLTTEHEYGPGSEQYQWLETDLLTATARRAAVPNIIVMLHRPLYSSKLKPDAKRAKLLQALEPLLVEHRVDVVLSGHDHNYERSYAVSDGEVLSQSATNAPAPIHIRVATGGMKPQLTKVVEPAPAWTAARSLEFGYGELTLFRNGSLGFVYREVSGEAVDRVLLARCRPACSENGQCVDGGVCVCDAGWDGATCSEPVGGAGAGLLWFVAAVALVGIAVAYRSRLPMVRELVAHAAARVRGTSRPGWARVPEIV